MNKLNLDPTLIESCRRHAARIAADTQDYIDEHSTVAVERATLRMLGIDGIDAFDIPLPNVVVDHIKEKADLAKGVCHYLAYAMHDTAKSPQEIAEAVASNRIDLSVYRNRASGKHVELLEPHISRMLTRIEDMTRFREERREEQDVPDRYVIVATGNIHEDIEQAVSAVRNGADIIAVIRSTGQSLLDFVPYGATTEGFGGTYATQENFRLMRQALDDVSQEVGRYVQLVNYASGLCMPEIAVMGAIERLDMMLNDSLYGIIFRDINMKRTLIDQYFSRVLSAYARIVINTGEDNYLTTADAFLEAHTVLASQFINEQFAKRALMKEELMGLGHAYEIDPAIENSFLYEIAQARMAREIFPRAPLKYMPPTKHMTGDIFMGVVQNCLFNVTAVTTRQRIHLLGMMTEAIHTPFMSDRALALKQATYIGRALKNFGDEIEFKKDGLIQRRAKTVLKQAEELLEAIGKHGIFRSLEQGVFAGTKRKETGGKGLEGVFKKDADYANPLFDRLILELRKGGR
ncbi:MAG: lysine 5,6-aminomutase subunit alpha [Acholeplasmataceae bacterium]